MFSVAAIIVTYNRKEMLEECLSALMKQTFDIDEIIVINNCSTDGTKEMLSEIRNISYVNLEENIGGAGGFNYGIKFAYNNGHDLFWVMDDDTIPNNNALEVLINEYNTLVKKESIGCLASNVLWKDGNPCLMNTASPVRVFNRYIENGIIEIEKATFVSCLISREAIKKCGLPIKEFFIWGDDAEFTFRLSKEFKNYLIGKSTVVHKMKVNMNADIVTEKERLNRYFYEYRNKFYNHRKYGIKSLLRHILDLFITIMKILFKSENKKFKKIYILFKGTIAGFVFNPKIEYLE